MNEKSKRSFRPIVGHPGYVINRKGVIKRMSLGVLSGVPLIDSPAGPLAQLDNSGWIFIELLIRQTFGET